MSNDPLEAVFVTGDEAAALKRADTARKLATYLERMPVELRGMFAEEFQHINCAELAQLRSDLAAAQERNVIERDAVHALTDRIVQQAAQLEQAREIILQLEGSNSITRLSEIVDAWLAANAQEQAA